MISIVVVEQPEHLNTTPGNLIMYVFADNY